MTHRFSRQEKGKWIKEDNKQTKKPPVIIPESDTSALIEDYKSTLIGRVTNPAVQNTRTLVDLFLQHWSVVGRITGRALGPQIFHFRFENERDLQVILNKAPFHFKRWMMLLQRWESTVSGHLPSMISFWITVHDLPLHYWTDVVMDAIGSKLGVVEDKDATKAHIRVQINGLKPLEMKRDIHLPSRAIKEVEFEYDKLEKHCF